MPQKRRARCQARVVARQTALVLVICGVAQGCGDRDGMSNWSAAPGPDAQQVANVVLLSKVWGFLKYHHPRVTSGDVPWDAELLRLLPEVIAARDVTGAQAALVDWLDRLGEPAACQPCARLQPEARAPDLAWIHDRGVLGNELASRLERVYRNRLVIASQAYVALAPGVGNALLREEPFEKPALPDRAHRLLALFRWWNVVEYWSPYRDLVPGDWDEVLREFVPRVVAAADRDAYRQVMLELVARLHDGHALIDAGLLPPRGDCTVPVRLRFVAGKAVITGGPEVGGRPPNGLLAGDAVIEIDGAPVDHLLESWALSYPASNEVARHALMMRFLTRGPCGDARVRVDRSGSVVDLHVQRVRQDEAQRLAEWNHVRPGPTVQRLTPEVVYLKLSSFKAEDVQSYLAMAMGSRALIIDIRCYPSEFAVFALGAHLVSHPTPFARFTRPDVRNPGAFLWGRAVELQPSGDHYDGQIVVLVDEATMSQGEYTAMALRAVPGSLIVGNTTAGADGNVTLVPLPGGLRTWISGLGVFYPDRTPTQQVGIIPDVRVEPTIAGVAAGRDEVLEEAMRVVDDPGRAVPRQSAGPSPSRGPAPTGSVPAFKARSSGPDRVAGTRPWRTARGAR